jgi:hypothetical protein
MAGTDRDRSGTTGLWTPRAAGAVLAAGLVLAGCGSPPGSATVGAATTRPAAALALTLTVGAAGGAGLLYAATTAGAGTVVSGFDRTSRGLVGQATLPGRFAFPVVATHAPPEGVSHDGRVVVLAGHDATASRFAVLDARLSRPAKIITLPPSFGYDALSAAGDTLYLIEHLPPAGSEHYVVRAYDLAAGVLVEGAVADKSRVPEDMAGHPTARATSPDGAVVATLYERTRGAPFVHVLHPGERFAVCVDLPARAAPGWTLGYHGDLLTVRDGGGVARLAVDDGGQVTPLP